MKRNIYIISLLFIAVLFSACEEVIILDLQTTEPRIVIEADLNGATGELEVKCSRTVDFYADSVFNPVNDAVVTLENGKGGALTIEEDEPGIYRLSGYSVIPGENYKINVTVDDIDYTAEAIAPVPAEIMEIAVEPFDIQGPPEEIQFYAIMAGWMDTPELESSYCIRIVINNNYPGSRILMNDDDQDGEMLLMTTMTNDIAPGDTVTVQLNAINKAVYEYFEQVDDMSSNGFSAAAPYNPKGNFSNDALGYFGVCYTNKKEAVVQ